MILEKEEREEILSVIHTLCDDTVTSFIYLNGILANISAYLAHTFTDINWVGFYYLAKDGSLILGPFQGEVACMVLPKGKGVCQKAVEEKASVVVGDVHLFPSHIACDSKSQSEVVIPIFVDDRVIAVLDVDSPHKHYFTSDIVELLQKVGEILNALFIQSKEYLDII